MNIFIVLSWKYSKVRKIVVYYSLISFLVLELLRSKDLKITDKRGTKNARSWINSFKIDKICDVMWWTSDPRQSLIILCLGKCLSESFETLKVNTTRHYPNDIFKKLVVIAMTLVPDPMNGYHEMRHNTAISRQNQLELWNQKAKQIFS